jgi:hypothetical protein
VGTELDADAEESFVLVMRGQHEITVSWGEQKGHLIIVRPNLPAEIFKQRDRLDDVTVSFQP